MSDRKVSVEGKAALVSGANRGIGKAIAVELLERGTKKVYAGVRDTSSLSDLQEKYGDRVVPLQLDVTQDDSIARVAETASDVEILVNNAGIIAPGGFMQGNIVESLQQNFDVNVFGVAKLTNGLVQKMAKLGSGAIVNVSSAAGLGNMAVIMSYSVSKAAVHSLTQGLRTELKDSNVLVSGVYPGPIDTDMTKGFEMQKDSPENVAKNVVDGIEAGEEDIFPDEASRQWGALYMKDPKGYERQLS